MNIKTVLLGGFAFYLAQFVVSMATGPLIHEGVLTEAYRATAGFWRPELNQVPPDMAALMPRWIAVGLVMAFILAALYTQLVAAFSGPGWLKGLKYGLGLGIVNLCIAAGWSGVFNLPDLIWAWWVLEGFAYFLAGGAALGWVAGKFSR